VENEFEVIQAGDRPATAQPMLLEITARGCVRKLAL
jgi:hypothetical protein